MTIGPSRDWILAESLYHYTRDLQPLAEYHCFDRPYTFTANNLTAHGVGKVTIKTLLPRQSGQTSTLTNWFKATRGSEVKLVNVLYIPDAKCNVLSEALLRRKYAVASLEGSSGCNGRLKGQLKGRSLKPSWITVAVDLDGLPRLQRLRLKDEWKMPSYVRVAADLPVPLGLVVSDEAETKKLDSVIKGATKSAVHHLLDTGIQAVVVAAAAARSPKLLGSWWKH